MDVNAVLVPCAARDANDLDLEPAEPSFDGLPDAAVSEDQHALVGERRGELVDPLPRAAGEEIEVPQPRKHQRDRQLGSRCVMHTRRVVEGHALGHEGPEAVDTGPQRLHGTESRHLRRGMERRRPALVGRDVEDDVIEDRLRRSRLTLRPDHDIEAVSSAVQSDRVVMPREQDEVRHGSTVPASYAE